VKFKHFQGHTRTRGNPVKNTICTWYRENLGELYSFNTMRTIQRTRKNWCVDLV